MTTMRIFNREPIVQGFTKCNSTLTSREQLALELEQALAQSQVKPTVVPGFTWVAPRPARSSWVDPEARLKREYYGITDAQQREAARDIAEHLKKIEMSTGLEVVE